MGRYVLDRKLAVGGMAEVYLARQMGPDGFQRPCVVKVTLPTFSADPAFVEMFLDEARLAAQLSHPNIAQVYDFGKENDAYYLAMEYVPGQTLGDIIDAQLAHRTFLPFGTAARLAADVAKALDYAHQAHGPKGEPLNVIHRDVSPSNVLVSETGTVKLIDFGIAKATMATHATNPGVIRGKYAYMSPEQVLGERMDRRTDIYSLGLVLYEMLTNARALDAERTDDLLRMAAEGRVVPAERLRPDLPAALLAILERALKKEPQGRYATAGEMGAALEDFEHQVGPPIKDADLVRLLSTREIRKVEQAPVYAPLGALPEPTTQPAQQAVPTTRALPPGEATSLTRARRWAPTIAIGAVALSGVGIYQAMGDDESEPAPPQHLKAEPIRPPPMKAPVPDLFEAAASQDAGSVPPRAQPVVLARTPETPPPSPKQPRSTPWAPPATGGATSNPRVVGIGDLLPPDQTRQVLDLLSRDVRDHPDDPQAHLRLAAALKALGQADQAAEESREVERLDPGGRLASQSRFPKPEESPVARAEHLIRQKRISEALDILRPEVRAHPDQARGHLFLGVALQRSGDPEGAVLQYRLFLKLAPNSPEAGKIREILHDYEALHKPQFP